jgi:hypothetical protein
MLNLNNIVENWHKDQTPVKSIDLLFRALSHPLGGLIEEHHALVFSFSDGDYLTAEYGDAGINLLYTKKSRPKIRAYENIMGKTGAKVEVYCISEAFDKTAFANMKLCAVFGAIEEMKERFRSVDYSALENNCQSFVKELIFLLNDKEYPYFIFLKPSLPPLGGPMSYYSDEYDEPTRGGYKVLRLNDYYIGYWNVNEKKFVEKWSCVIL